MPAKLVSGHVGLRLGEVPERNLRAVKNAGRFVTMFEEAWRRSDWAAFRSDDHYGGASRRRQVLRWESDSKAVVPKTIA